MKNHVGKAVLAFLGVAGVAGASLAAEPGGAPVAREGGCRVSVTVLGSGGPMHGGGRGDSAYLVQAGSRPLLVVDMGGDTPTSLARAGVQPGTIPVLAISHMHPDHVSGIPDYVWGEIQVGRHVPLSVIGPAAAPKYRSAEQLFAKLFDADGAFPALSDTMTGKSFPIQFTTAAGDGSVVFSNPDLTIKALRVVHADLPALAYRVEVDGRSVVFSGDKDVTAVGLARLAEGADLMVAHAIGDEASGSSSLRRTIATPSEIGDVARRAHVKRLVLSHWLGAPAGAPNAQYWSLPRLPSVVATVRRIYGGPTDVAHDLSRYDVGGCATR